MPKVGLIPTVRFNLKNHDPIKDKNNDVLISLVFRYNKKKVVYSTGLKVKPKHWTGSSAKVVIEFNKAYASLNKRLRELADHCTDIFTEHNNGEIEVLEFKKELDYRTGKKERPTYKSEIPSLMEFIEIYIRERSKINKTNNYDKVVSVRNHLIKFGEERGSELNYDDINWQFKAEFEAWLYDSPRNHSQNTANKIFKVVKQILKAARLRNFHTNRNAEEREFSIKKVKVKNKVRYNENEVKTIMALDLSEEPHLDRVRDLFIAACYCGLRVSDWRKINKEHIIDRKGILRLKVMTQKTKSIVSIPIKKELLTILQKYNFELPQMQSQPFNRSIKQVVKLALPDSTFLRVYNTSGITKDEIAPKWKYTASHCGRRTFASNRYMEGWALRTIKNILGHATEAQTEEYMDISDEELSDREARLIELSEMAQTLRAVKAS